MLVKMHCKISVSDHVKQTGHSGLRHCGGKAPGSAPTAPLLKCECLCVCVCVMSGRGVHAPRG